MEQNDSKTLPRLDTPGAGLPGPELWAARVLFRWSLWRSTRAKATDAFVQQRDAILGLVRSCDPAAATRRVLIRRLRGMEDSSRNWSVCMTQDHLRIVNDACAGIIAALTAGKVPPKPASTAAVKPDAEVDLTAITAFEDSCRRFEETVAARPDLATPLKYSHPWFGPLDAAAWHFMAGFHMDLHRRQIARIIAGL